MQRCREAGADSGRDAEMQRRQPDGIETGAHRVEDECDRRLQLLQIQRAAAVRIQRAKEHIRLVAVLYLHTELLSVEGRDGVGAGEGALGGLVGDEWVMGSPHPNWWELMSVGEWE